MIRIAVDLDGVIWDIMEVFLELYNKKYNQNVKYEDVSEWYFFPNEAFETIYPRTLKRIKDYPFLDRWISYYLLKLMRKHEVKILTHEANNETNLKIKLLEAGIREGHEYLELIRQDRHTDEKLDVEFDVYIDDCPLLVEKMKNYPDRILLLYDQPWNWYIKDEKYDNVIRVKNWKEVYRTLKSFK